MLACNISELKFIREAYEINVRYAYVLQSLGKGITSGKIFTGVMNIALPSRQFDFIIVYFSELQLRFVEHEYHALEYHEGSGR